MEITEVRVELADLNRSPNARIRGYARVVLGGDWAINGLRIVEGYDGLFVAMPSRRVLLRCPRCESKVFASLPTCPACGGEIPELHPDRPVRPHADVAHPINESARAQVTTAVLAAYTALDRYRKDRRSPAEIPT